MVDTWTLVAAERGRLVDTLVKLDEAQWNEPSLCADWTAKQMLAHIVFTAEITPATFLLGMARSGFRFHRMSARNVERFAADTPEQLVARLTADIPNRNHPPGPTALMLMETVVHGEDIAYPLGAAVDHTGDGLIGAAEFARNAQALVGCRKRIAGLSLRATDLDWSTGDGPEVSGPMVALLLAMSGRRPALDALTGEGVAALRARM